MAESSNGPFAPFQAPGATSAESTAWCAGWKAAMAAVRLNRDHYRQMLALQFPFETNAETLARITANKFGRNNAGTLSMGQLILDGIDLYIIPPPVECK